MITSQAKP